MLHAKVGKHRSLSGGSKLIEQTLILKRLVVLSYLKADKKLQTIHNNITMI